MSYVDAINDKENDIIRVVERDINGKRVYKEYPARHLFYYNDPKGKFRSIKEEPLSRVVAKNSKELRKELSIHSSHKLHESDINPIYRCLADNYLNAEPPKLNVAFYEIETDMQPYAYSSQHKVKIRPRKK